jgi:integrase/recombinase XerD
VTTLDGVRLNRHQVRRIVARLARAAGLSDPAKVTPHSGRRAFLTLAREAGVPLQDVQDAVDHRDPRTTQRYDRGRHRLDKAPTYRLAAYRADAGYDGSGGHG